MKKLLGLVLSGMLVISMLGCENNEDTEDSNSLSIEESNELQEQEQAVDEPSVDDVDDYEPSSEEIENYLKTGEFPDSADTSVKLAKFRITCREAREKIVEMLGAEYEIRCKTNGLIDEEDFLKEKGYVDGKIYLP